MSDVDKRKPPHDDYCEGLPSCANCGQDFFEHMDTGDDYLCPHEYQQEACYGSFCGGDPRNFHPDHECTTPTEYENWKKACADAEIAANPNLPCPSGWERLPDGSVAHVLRCPFGLGITTFPPMCYEKPQEADRSC